MSTTQAEYRTDIERLRSDMVRGDTLIILAVFIAVGLATALLGIGTAILGFIQASTA